MPTNVISPHCKVSEVIFRLNTMSVHVSLRQTCQIIHHMTSLHINTYARLHCQGFFFFKLQSLLWHLPHISPLCPFVGLFLWGGKQNTTVDTYFIALPHFFWKMLLSLRGVFRQAIIVTECYVQKMSYNTAKVSQQNSTHCKQTHHTIGQLRGAQSICHVVHLFLTVKPDTFIVKITRKK